MTFTGHDRNCLRSCLPILVIFQCHTGKKSKIIHWQSAKGASQKTIWNRTFQTQVGHLCTVLGKTGFTTTTKHKTSERYEQSTALYQIYWWIACTCLWINSSQATATSGYWKLSIIAGEHMARTAALWKSVASPMTRPSTTTRQYISFFQEWRLSYTLQCKETF